MTWRRGTLLVALVVTMLTVASCGEHSSASSSRTTSTSTPTTTVPPVPKPIVSVDLADTPSGWVPVDYDNAQVSVPPSWVIWMGCSQPDQGTIFLTGISPIEKVLCRNGDNFVALGPGSTATKGEVEVINGITVYNFQGVWNVPSLGVQLSLIGPLSSHVLHTLTHSPRSVVLASGPEPSVPASWHRVGFGGVSIALPSKWYEERTTTWGGCGFSDLSLPEPPTAVLTTGANFVRLPCPLVLAPPVVPPADGLVIDPGPYGPLQGVSSFGTCLHINDLTACPTTTDVYGVLVMAVHVPGRTQPVAVEIGLAGNGMVTRTILYSMRAG